MHGLLRIDGLWDLLLDLNIKQHVRSRMESIIVSGLETKLAGEAHVCAHTWSPRLIRELIHDRKDSASRCEICDQSFCMQYGQIRDKVIDVFLLWEDKLNLLGNEREKISSWASHQCLVNL